MLSEEAILEQCNAQQLRLLCLLNAYQPSLMVTNEKLEEVKHYDAMVVEFFTSFKEEFNQMVKIQSINPYQKLTEDDLMFDQRLSSVKKEIHLAMCHGIDLPSVMNHMYQIFIMSKEYRNSNGKINIPLIRNVDNYLTYLFSVFGLKAK
jgi:cysteinyl-tRNA synthetase